MNFSRIMNLTSIINVLHVAILDDDADQPFSNFDRYQEKLFAHILEERITQNELNSVTCFSILEGVWNVDSITNMNTNC